MGSFYPALPHHPETPQTDVSLTRVWNKGTEMKKRTPYGLSHKPSLGFLPGIFLGLLIPQPATR